MGTLRKMGAFLGLVPDETEVYAARGERDGRYAADDHDADYDQRFAGDYDASYDSGYVADDADGTDHDRAYAADGYQHRDAYAADASDDTVGAYARTSDYDTDTDEHAGRELEYAGRYADTPSVDHASYSPYAGSDRSQPVESRPQSVLGGGRRTSGKSGRGAGRATEDVDYSTQGALAVQPHPVEVVAADPATGKPATVSLTGFADAREVGELYRTGQAVILDMTELTDAEARRMVDFAAGLAFAVRGSIDKVTTKVFMLHQPESESDRSGR